MFNKFKIHMIKNSLDTITKNIFEYLCNEDNSNTIQENKDLAIEYASLPIVKEHNIGRIYEIEALRYAVLDCLELDLFEKAMTIIDKFYELQKEIEKEGYKILCSPASMKKLVLECKNISELNSAISIMQKELLSLEDNISRSNKEKYQPSNTKGISISSLNDSQKESLTSLGFDETKDKVLTLATLKKMYNRKLYSINYDKTKNASDDYLKEISDAFSNLKQAFEVSC